jgi:hypothetical protein
MTPFEIVDSLLVAPYRLLETPEAAFYFGTFFQAVASAALGLGCKALVARSQRAKREHADGETARRAELSAQAAQAGNKAAYMAQNNLAQEAYGDSMALAAGRGAALLWPGMLTLAWLYWRFEGVAIPYLWNGAGPATVFLPPHIAALWGISRLMREKKSAPNASVRDASQAGPG